MAILALAMVFMFAVTFFAFQVLKWQSADISVSIVSESDEGSNEVTISVLNTAGSTLLFYENAEVTGKIEYLSENGWVEYCKVSYTQGNANAVSQQYGGTFAELEPGENWDVSVPEDKIAGMKDGTYRIKMTYITEKQYNQYLENAFENRSNSIESEISEDTEVSEFTEERTNDSLMRPILGSLVSEEEESSKEEQFLASNECEVFVKTFEYTAPEDFVDAISIDDEDIESSKISKSKATDKIY